MRQLAVRRTPFGRQHRAHKASRRVASVGQPRPRKTPKLRSTNRTQAEILSISGNAPVESPNSDAECRLTSQRLREPCPEVEMRMSLHIRSRGPTLNARFLSPQPVTTSKSNRRYLRQIAISAQVEKYREFASVFCDFFRQYL